MTGASDPAAGRGLRISYLFPQFPVRTEVFAVSDIAALRAQGHEVVVHTMKPAPRDLPQRMKTCRVPADLAVLRPRLSTAWTWPALLWRRRRDAASLIRLIAGSARTGPRTAVTALACVPRALEIVEEVRLARSDVVHVFWSRHAALALPLLDGAEPSPALSSFVGAYDLVADDFLVALAMKHSNVVFSHAEANRGFVEARAAARTDVEIVHRGIPLPPIADDSSRDPDLWVTASALVRSKNVEAVLRAFAQARARRPGLKLLVFGAGPDRRRLEGCAAALGCAEAVAFRGHVGREALFDAMRSAAVFLLLSRKPSERLPNVVKEALWAGCAVIVSRSEGIEELVPDAGVGLVVAPDDLASLAAAIDAVLSESEATARRRRQRARGLVAGRFSSERSMERYASAWRRVLARRPGEARAAASPPGARLGAEAGRGSLPAGCMAERTQGEFA